MSAMKNFMEGAREVEQYVAQLEAENQRLIAENKRLTSENERLRAEDFSSSSGQAEEVVPDEGGAEEIATDAGAEDVSYTIIDKSKEQDKFYRAVKEMKILKEDILMCHNELGVYMRCSWEEAYPEFVRYKEKGFKLEKSNIRTWKWGKQKFFRLTFTHEKIHCRLSRIEFIFGYTIDGLTFLVKKEDWLKHKENNIFQSMIEE